MQSHKIDLKLLEKLEQKIQRRIDAMSAEAPKIIEMIAVQPHDSKLGVGEFNKRNSENEKQVIIRLEKHIKDLALRAVQVHLENNFSNGSQILQDASRQARSISKSGKSTEEDNRSQLQKNLENKTSIPKMNPHKQNVITRLSLNEFSLYPSRKRGPLSLKGFNDLILKIKNIASVYPENLHLVLASIPVKMVQNNIKNLVVYVECGKNPKLQVFAKAFVSDIDPVYPRTESVEFSDATNLVPYPQLFGKSTFNAGSITFGGNILSKTSGGVLFRTVIDICLDHKGAIGKKIIADEINTVRGFGLNVLPKYASHLIVSNTVNVDNNNLISRNITQADPHNKIIVDIDSMGDSEQDVHYSHTKKQIIFNPHFGGRTEITIYPLRQLGHHKDEFEKEVNLHNRNFARLEALRQYRVQHPFDFIPVQDEIEKLLSKLFIKELTVLTVSSNVSNHQIKLIEKYLEQFEDVNKMNGSVDLLSLLEQFKIEVCMAPLAPSEKSDPALLLVIQRLIDLVQQERTECGKLIAGNPVLCNALSKEDLLLLSFTKYHFNPEPSEYGNHLKLFNEDQILLILEKTLDFENFILSIDQDIFQNFPPSLRNILFKKIKKEFKHTINVTVEKHYDAVFIPNNKSEKTNLVEHKIDLLQNLLNEYEKNISDPHNALYFIPIKLGDIIRLLSRTCEDDVEADAEHLIRLMMVGLKCAEHNGLLQADEFEMLANMCSDVIQDIFHNVDVNNQENADNIIELMNTILFENNDRYLPFLQKLLDRFPRILTLTDSTGQSILDTVSSLQNKKQFLLIYPLVLDKITFAVDCLNNAILERENGMIEFYCQQTSEFADEIVKLIPNDMGQHFLLLIRNTSVEYVKSVLSELDPSFIVHFMKKIKKYEFENYSSSIREFLLRHMVAVSEEESNTIDPDLEKELNFLIPVFTDVEKEIYLKHKIYIMEEIINQFEANNDPDIEAILILLDETIDAANTLLLDSICNDEIYNRLKQLSIRLMEHKLVDDERAQFNFPYVYFQKELKEQSAAKSQLFKSPKPTPVSDLEAESRKTPKSSR